MNYLAGFELKGDKYHFQVLEHEIHTKGSATCERDGEEVEFFFQEHTLNEIIYKVDADEVDDLVKEGEYSSVNDMLNNESIHGFYSIEAYDREDIECFWLSGYAEGLRLDYLDIMANDVEVCDWNGSSDDWSEISKANNREQAIAMFEAYRDMFTEAKSFDEFLKDSIDN